MNEIVAKAYRTRFASEPHLVVWIDGEPLDHFLDSRCSGRDLMGLVPTWLDWMLEEAEQRVAFERMKPPVVGRVKVPLLMCPDDLDFHCSVVIADLRAEEDFVEWTRLGFDRTKSTDPEAIGVDVEWFDGIGPLRFKRADYEACIEAFLKANAQAEQGG